jgi:hypothetical protein
VEGQWSMAKALGQQMEVWEKENRNLIRGKGLKIMGSDTIIAEHLEIRYMNGSIWYIPTVPDQNDAQPVPFKITTQDERNLVFENAAHDFPQRIAYRYVPKSRGADSLYVRVENLQGNGIDFRFERRSISR